MPLNKETEKTEQSRRLLDNDETKEKNTLTFSKTREYIINFPLFITNVEQFVVSFTCVVLSLIVDSTIIGNLYLERRGGILSVGNGFGNLSSKPG